MMRVDPSQAAPELNPVQAETHSVAHREAPSSGRGQSLDVVLLSISQATAATFTDLYIKNTFLVFIHVGSKRVLCPVKGELIGQAGDVIIFPAGTLVTLENRPVLTAQYRATGLCFPQQMVSAVFSEASVPPTSIQVVQGCAGQSGQVLAAIKSTLNDSQLPASIRQHRLLEPLIWLKGHNVSLSSHEADNPLSQVRQLIETDLSHAWRSSEVAEHFAISEATLRRWLARSGQGFSKILQNTRLEYGLSLLQSTDMPIANIALDCGFKAPSHFSDSFKRRFGIPPSAIRQSDS